MEDGEKVKLDDKSKFIVLEEGDKVEVVRRYCLTPETLNNPDILRAMMPFLIEDALKSPMTIFFLRKKDFDSNFDSNADKIP